MPSLDFRDPKVIRYLLESYEKESRLRMKWVQLHAGNFQKAATFTREERNYTIEDISKTVMEAGMVAITRDHVASARHRTTAPIPDYKRIKVGMTKETEAPMKPVAQVVRNSLKEGRFEYLKKRSSLKPEDKYSFVESSNWMYGWKLGESELKMSGPKFGKVNHVMHNLCNHVGPQRDPEHYFSPDLKYSHFVTI